MLLPIGEPNIVELETADIDVRPDADGTDLEIVFLATSA